MKYDVLNRWTGDVQFTADIECSDDSQRKIKLGQAVLWASKVGADLRGADLGGIYLRYACLLGADLHCANLSGADLRGTDLSDSCLRGVNLKGAGLNGTILRGAGLADANLKGIYLGNTDLRCADLRCADLSDTNMKGTDLYDADLRGANLSGADLPHFQLPGGELEGWKKLRGNCIARVVIPWGAKRTATPVSRKCRAEFVITRDIWDRHGNEITEGASWHSHFTIYRVGEPTYPNSYDGDIRVDCTNGIHFFLTREEAEEW